MTAIKALRVSWPLLSLLLLVAAVAVVFGMLVPGMAQPVVYALINVMVVVGLYTFIGNSGVLSFGHVSFMAIGAYVCGILTMPMIARAVMIPNVPEWIRAIELNTPLGVIAGAIVAGVVGLIIGIPLVRLNGLAAGLAMFAFLLIVNVVLKAWEPGTSGGGTLSRIPTDIKPADALVWVLVVIVLAFLFQRSRWGLRLRASREDEQAARSLGIGVTKERLGSFALSAFFVGLGGGLFSHYVGTLTPDTFFIATTFLTLAMLVIGGINSLAGAVVGTLVISAITYILDRWTNGQAVGPIAIPLPPGSSQIVVAILMLLFLILRPEGLTRGREFTLRLLGRSRSTPESDATDQAAETVDQERWEKQP
jgi:branched-chain amino acid transport system permease protein